MKQDFTKNAAPNWEFYAAYLTATQRDLGAFEHLQATVRQDLRSKPHFIKPRSKADVIEHISARMPVIGVFAQAANRRRVLAGSALITFPDREEAKYIEGYPLNNARNVTTVINTLCTHPDFAGRGVSQHILHAAEYVAGMCGHTGMMAKISVDNVSSRRAFEKAGFNEHSKGFDPKKGYEVVYVTKSIVKPAVTAAVLKLHKAA